LVAGKMIGDCMHMRGHHTLAKQILSLDSKLRQFLKAKMLSMDVEKADAAQYVKNKLSGPEVATHEMGETCHSIHELAQTYTLVAMGEQPGIDTTDATWSAGLWETASGAVQLAQDMQLLKLKREQEALKKEQEIQEAYKTVGDQLLAVSTGMKTTPASAIEASAVKALVIEVPAIYTSVTEEPDTEAPAVEDGRGDHYNAQEPQGLPQGTWHGQKPVRLTTKLLVEEMRSIYTFEFQSQIAGCNDLNDMLLALSKSLSRSIPFTAAAYNNRFRSVLHRMLRNLGFLRPIPGAADRSTIRLQFFEFLHIMTCRPLVHLLPVHTRVALSVLADEESMAAETGHYEKSVVDTSTIAIENEEFLSSVVSTYGTLGPLAFVCMTDGVKELDQDGSNSAPPETGPDYSHLLYKPSNPSDLSVASDVNLLYTYQFQGAIRSVQDLCEMVERLWMILRKPLPILMRNYKGGVKR